MVEVTRLDPIKIRSLPPRFQLRFGHPKTPTYVEVERIGRGRFCAAYRRVDYAECVYLVVKEEDGDYSKRILQKCEGPYFPTLLEVGSMVGSDYPVYQTQYYERLTAKHKAAWAELKLLAKLREDAWAAVVTRHSSKMRVADMGYLIMDETISLLRSAEPQRTELADALQQVRDASTNYGSGYTFEFAARNLGVDGNGHLILLDPVFDLETTARDHAERLKRAQRQY